MSYYVPVLSTPVIAGWKEKFTSAQQTVMKGYKGKDPK